MNVKLSCSQYGSVFIQFCVLGSVEYKYNATESVLAIQGHPIKSATNFCFNDQ